MDTNNYLIILAGGSGTRLWPLSRQLKPKQFINLDGSDSLFQQTIKRSLEVVSADRIYVVANQDHKHLVIGQLYDIDPQLAQNVYVEPSARNTLPAISWMVAKIESIDPEAVVSVFPSDHIIGNQKGFVNCWKQAIESATQNNFALFGIQPTRAAVDYGYLHVGQTQDQVAPVQKFEEKPQADVAQKYFDSGEYYWNSGMFVFKAQVFQAALQKHQKDTYDFFKVHGQDQDIRSELYITLPALSIDYGLMEYLTSGVTCVVSDFNWNDLGSWQSFYEYSDKTADNNVEVGDVVSERSSENLFYSTQGTIAALGVKGLAVVQTGDCTLICPREEAGNLKDLTSKLSGSHKDLMQAHLTVNRPWGSYTVLRESDDIKVKVIDVEPGQKLSMQMHHHRAEHWVVVEGVADIHNNGKDFQLKPGEATFIDKQARHRLTNSTDQKVRVLEVQFGDYLGEDDIVRFDDVYGRAKKAG